MEFDVLHMVGQRIAFRGHPMIRATHVRTIEVTTEDNLTENGDCIIGVSADSGCAGLDEGLKDALRRPGAVVQIRVEVGGEQVALEASGSPGLSLSHSHDIVIRKSWFLSDRTLALGASMSSRDIPRSIVKKLRNSDAVGHLQIEVV